MHYRYFCSSALYLYSIASTDSRSRGRMPDRHLRQSDHTEGARKRKADEAFRRKENNRRVIADTLTICENLETVFGKPPKAHACVLPGCVPRSIMYRENSLPTRYTCPSVEIYDGDCVCLAREIQKQPGAKVWMLDMASSGKPGGGARSGKNAQEEHLCRCSNLLPQLEWAATKHYPLHEQQPHGMDFKVLVLPEVVFFKDASDYSELSPKDWFRIGVIAAAAENISETHYSVGPNATRYIDYLLDVVSMQDCSHIILSAWGCGAFKQSAEEVAKIFKQSLTRFDASSFPQVTFAIIDDHNSQPPGNLHAFQSVFPNSANYHFRY